MKKLILASQSPRRKMLLDMAEIECSVQAAGIEEHYPPGIALHEIPGHIARNKAAAVVAGVPAGELVLAADTIVVLDGQIIGKPSGRRDALDILARLSGRSHEVITGVCLREGEKEIVFSDTTEVVFRELSAEQIAYYVDKYQPYDKAGAYAIQEWIGLVAIRSIRGDFYNVMGLPVGRLMEVLRQWG